MKKKHKICFSKNDKSAVLELCVFCERNRDLSLTCNCTYYSEAYDDNHCTGFVKAKNIEERLSSALEIHTKTS